MASLPKLSAAPPPMAGTPIDPAPKDVPVWAERLDQTMVGGIAYRAESQTPLDGTAPLQTWLGVATR